MREAIETAPKDGTFVILEDAAHGTFEVARWSAERAQWVDLEGTSSQLNATHWEYPQTVDELVTPGQPNKNDLHPSSPAPDVVSSTDKPGTPAVSSKPTFRRAHPGASSTIAAFERAAADGASADIIAAITGGDGARTATNPAVAAATTDGLVRNAIADRAGLNETEDKSDTIAASYVPSGATSPPVNTRAEFARPVGSGDGKMPSALAAAGRWSIRRQRIATMAACLFVGVVIAIPAVELVAAQREVELQRSIVAQAAGIREAAERGADEQRRTLQAERDKAEKLAAALAEARSSLEALTKANPAGAKEAAERSADELRRALQVERDKTVRLAAALTEAKSGVEALATELAMARQEIQSQLSAAAAAKAQAAGAKEAAERSAEEQRRALLIERDKTEKLGAALAEARSSLEVLTTELATARREVQSQQSAAASAKAQITSMKDAAERSADELQRALKVERDKSQRLAAALAEAQSSLEAQTKANAASAKDAAERNADELRRALQVERDKAEKFATALAEAKSSLEALAKANPAGAKEAAERSADELRRALQVERDKAEKLATALAEAKSSLEALAKANPAAAKEAAVRSADELRRALQVERDKGEKLTAALAAARSSLDALTKTNAAGVKEAAEGSADELRRAVQLERDKAEKLTAALAEAKSSLEALTKAKATDDGARDDKLVALRRDLQKAKTDAAVALELLEAEYTRREQIEQRLAMIQATAKDPGSRAPPPPAMPVIGQPSPAAPPVAPAPAKTPTADAAPPVASPVRPDARVDQDNPLAARLIARANVLLEQGNIGAARNMFDQAAAMGSAEALFWLAQTYDPLLLSARKTVGTQSDVAKARELYGKALAAGISDARLRLDALKQ